MRVRFLRSLGAVVCTAVAGLLRLSAQDVTVAPLEWLHPVGPGYELPLLELKERLDFPDDLKKTSQIGWTEVNYLVSRERNIFFLGSYASLSFYEDAVHVFAGEGNLASRPGLYQGKPAESRVRRVYVFNPASAGLNGPDATPRLLTAAVIEDPAMGGKSALVRHPPVVVWVELGLDEKGAIVSVAAPSSRYEALIRAHLDQWRFAPARHGGVPVAAKVAVPMIFQEPDGARQTGYVPPRSIQRIPPIYPLAERKEGVTGEVLVGFTIDQNGVTHDVQVLRMTTSGFGMSAVRAIRQWVFAPQTVDGKPVTAYAEQPIDFNMEGEENDAGNGVTVVRRGNVAKLPENVRFDVPPKVRRLVQPKYPFELLRNSVRGSAQVFIIIDAQGRVSASKVVKADRPEFGYALQAAVEQFEYQPALKNGDPTSTVLTVSEDFEPSFDRSLMFTEAEVDAYKLEIKHPERIAKPGELDAKPKPYRLSAPLRPRSATQAAAGEALVEFLIGERGEVLLPRLVSASEPAFGYAAVQSVALWTFVPPTKGGKPTIVRVRAPVAFKAPPGQAGVAAGAPKS